MATLLDFNTAFLLTVGHEGGYSNNPNDPGNWTGGDVGVGELKGTNYGISAASYPDADIENLTLMDAKIIYETDYWAPSGCPEMQPRLAMVMFDASVNNGVGRAVGWLQGAIGATPDGIFGDQTSRALMEATAEDPNDFDLAAEVHAQRIFFMAQLTTWDDFGLGWSRRLARVPLQTSLYWPSPPAPPLE